MSDESTTKRPEPVDGDKPVNQRDLLWLEQRMEERFRRIDGRFQELRDHFDAAVENIADALQGAQADEMSLVKEKQLAHEDRIAALERREDLPG